MLLITSALNLDLTYKSLLKVYDEQEPFLIIEPVGHKPYIVLRDDSDMEMLAKLPPFKIENVPIDLLNDVRNNKIEWKKEGDVSLFSKVS